MDYRPWEEEAAAVFRGLLSDSLEDLLAQVEEPSPVALEKVMQAVRDIASTYRHELNKASAEFRSDWDDPVNRCGYVFVYVAHHCFLTFCALLHGLGAPIAWREWAGRPRLRLCSVGGGPGSDLVGLLQFLRRTGLVPEAGVECQILDRCSKGWRRAWDVLGHRIPWALRSWFESDRLSVTYHRCDAVGAEPPPPGVLDFAAEADLVTLIKSFSAVSAFIRDDSSRGEWLRRLLSTLRPGCLLLLIDNCHHNVNLFRSRIADRVGLCLIRRFEVDSQMPNGQYSSTIQKYCKGLNYSPMNGCKVFVEIYQKVPPPTKHAQPVIYYRPPLASLQQRLTHQSSMSQLYHRPAVVPIYPLFAPYGPHQAHVPQVHRPSTVPMNQVPYGQAPILSNGAPVSLLYHGPAVGHFNEIAPYWPHQARMPQVHRPSTIPMNQMPYTQAPIRSHEAPDVASACTF